MLRLLILFLILQGSAATSEDTEGYPSGFGDDEDGDGDSKNVRTIALNTIGSEGPEASPGSDKSTGDDDAAGGTLIIIIAAVSVAVLVIGSIAAFVLFRRYLQSREQGVYSVPAEQGQKAAV